MHSGRRGGGGVVGILGPAESPPPPPGSRACLHMAFIAFSRGGGGRTRRRATDAHSRFWWSGAAQEPRQCISLALTCLCMLGWRRSVPKHSADAKCFFWRGGATQQRRAGAHSGCHSVAISATSAPLRLFLPPSPMSGARKQRPCESNGRCRFCNCWSRSRGGAVAPPGGAEAPGI